MKIKKSIGSHIFDTFNIIFLSLLSLAALYPIWYVLMGSFSKANELIQYTGIIWKNVGFSLDAYKAVFSNKNIYIGYGNTVLYVFAGSFVNLLMTSLGAYGVSRKDFFWKKFIMIMIMVTMFFGGGLIPTYLLIRSLNLINNPLVMILPGAITTYNLIIMRTAFMAIPYSLEEAAKIDGADDFYILFKIIIPLALPTMAVVGLYYGVAHWNSWFDAMIYLRNRNLYPLQLFLREILINSQMSEFMEGSANGDFESIAETIKYATIMVATVPILLAYPFLQKFFVKGVMIGAVKG